MKAYRGLQVTAGIAASPIHAATKGIFMNKDQIKGAAKNAAGKVQEQAGKVVGSTAQQA